MKPTYRNDPIQKFLARAVVRHHPQSEEDIEVFSGDCHGLTVAYRVTVIDVFCDLAKGIKRMNTGREEADRASMFRGFVISALTISPLQVEFKSLPPSRLKLYGCSKQENAGVTVLTLQAKGNGKKPRPEAQRTPFCCWSRAKVLESS